MSILIRSSTSDSPRHLEISRNAFWWRGAILSSRLAQVCSTRAKAFSPGKRDCFAIWKKASRQKIFRVGKIAAYQTTARRDRSVIPANTPHTTPLYNTKMACIASTFTGSVAALKASKVQVRRATRARALSRASPAREVDVGKLRFPAAGAALPAPGLVRGRRLRRIARRRRSLNALSRRSPGRSRAPDPRDGPGVARPARRERFREFLVQLNSAVAHHATSGD